MRVKQLMKLASTFWEHNDAAILSGFAMAGAVLTGIIAFKAGMNARDILAAHNYDCKLLEKHEGPLRPNMVDKKQLDRTMYKDMALTVIPPIVAGGVTVASMFGSTKKYSTKVALLSTAYTLTTNTFKDYKEEVEKMFGPKKAKQIRDNMIKTQLERDGDFMPPEDVPGGHKTLCYDTYCRRYFRADPQEIYQAINCLSQDCMGSMYVSLNELYDLIDNPELPPCPAGDSVGWRVEDMVGGKLPIHTSSQLAPRTSEPCFCLEYTFNPYRNFRELY